MLLTVDGLHGAGKTALVRTLAEELAAHGRSVSVTASNSDRDWSNELRTLRATGRLRAPETFVLFELADLALRTEEWAERAAHPGAVVIADRYLISIVARGLVRGMSRKILEDLCAVAPAADVSVLVDVPAEVAVARQKPPTDRDWQSGFGFAPDGYGIDVEAYAAYQQAFGVALHEVARAFGATVVDGLRSTGAIVADLMPALLERGDRDGQRA